jgi:hypothetical protein
MANAAVTRMVRGAERHTAYVAAAAAVSVSATATQNAKL